MRKPKLSSALASMVESSQAKENHPRTNFSFSNDDELTTPTGEEDGRVDSLTYLHRRSGDIEHGGIDLRHGNGTPNIFTTENSGVLHDTNRKIQKWWKGQTDDEGIPRSDSIASVQNIKELRQRRASERRLVEKEGRLKVVSYHGQKAAQLRKHFFDDIFTTSVDLQWRYIILGFTASFFTSWVAFAGIWHLIFYIHGDLEEDHLPDKQEETGWVPCVYAIYGFSSTFLYSVETQHTIGYGLRGSSHQCASTVILQCIQSIIGVAIQACMAGIVFAKLARPKKRAKTVHFSRNAVISLVNGKLRLLFRVGNVRNSLLLESHFRAEFLGNIITREGTTFRHYPTRLNVSTQLDQDPDEESDINATLFLPTIVCHVIDSTSPLYELTPAQLIHSKIEIIVTLEGIVEPSGNTTQVRTSYLPHEILWGHTFANCVTWVNKDGSYLVDHSKLNCTMPDETPRLSAKRLDTICSTIDAEELGGDASESGAGKVGEGEDDGCTCSPDSDNTQKTQMSSTRTTSNASNNIPAQLSVKELKPE